MHYTNSNISAAYTLLGVPETCQDLRAIKQAYRAQKHATEVQSEKATLRTAYVCIKDVLKGFQQHEERNSHRAHLDPSEYHHRNSAAQFQTQLAHDNSMIEDDFDIDRAYSDMSRDRPTTTSYQAILQDFKNNTSNGRPIRDSRNARQDHPCPDAFGGFEHLGGAAPIICDGTFMFVQGAANDQESDRFAPLTDNATSLLAKRDATMLNDMGVSEYLRTRDSVMMDAEPPRLSANEFRSKLSMLENARRDSVASEARKNSTRVQQQLSRLSAQTREGLFSYDAALRIPS